MPKAIYKYRIWGDENTDRIIKNKEIYLASPGIFKDGYNECILKERYDLVTTALLMEKIKQDTRNEFKWMTEKDVETRAMKRINDCKFFDTDNRKQVEQWSNKIQNDNLGIFCSSISKTSIEMWEKFGNLSTGYCVGLIPSELIKNPKLSGQFGKVKYYPESKPPEILPINLNKDDALYNAILQNFSVPQRFKYENEYRIAKYNFSRNEYSGEFFRIKYDLNSRRVEISEKCYKEIILGSEIYCQDKKDIVKLCAINLPNIPIYESIFDEKTKKISFKKIN